MEKKKKTKKKYTTTHATLRSLRRNHVIKIGNICGELIVSHFMQYINSIDCGIHVNKGTNSNFGWPMKMYFSPIALVNIACPTYLIQRSGIFSINGRKISGFLFSLFLYIFLNQLIMF